jgi:hypothetical protein
LLPLQVSGEVGNRQFAIGKYVIANCQLKECIILQYKKSEIFYEKINSNTINNAICGAHYRADIKSLHQLPCNKRSIKERIGYDYLFR